MMEVKNFPAPRILVYCFAVLIIILLSVQQFASGSRGVCSRRLSRQRAESYYERIYYATTTETTTGCPDIRYWFRCPVRRRIRVSRAVGRTRYHTDYYYQQHCCSGYSGSPPNCRLCPALNHIANGATSRNSGVEGSVTTFSCNSGYGIVGSPSRTCLSDGTWSLSLPTCKRVCPTLNTITNGATSLNSRFVGSVANCSCNSGYGIVGSPSRTCLSDGTWSLYLPTCKRVCPTLNTITNGATSLNSRFVGSVANCSCNSGYGMVGSPSRTCLSDGIWSSPLPTCERVCPTLSNTTEMYLIFSSTQNFVHSVASYTCKFGYGMVGPCTQTCLSTGEWSGFSPNCYQLVLCPEPNDPTNGTASWIHRAVGNIITYTCSPGYVLVGASNRTCQENEAWTETAPECDRVCPVLYPPRNGTLVVSTYFVNGSASYSCNSGYQLVGSSTSNCLSTGSWSSLPPTCDRVCPKLTNLINGVVHISSYFVGDVATYDCDDGFGLLGPATRNCLSNGTWSVVSTTCDPVCHLLQHPGNGSVNISSYFFGDIAHYTCDTGYELLGHSDRRCESNKLWSGAQPICKLVECHKLSSPHNGFVAVDSNNFGGIARFRCSAGHGLFGSPRRTCMFNGYWSGVQPFCRYIVCTVLSNPENGKVDADSSLFGDVAMYTCSIGYRLIGSDQRECLGNSTWSGTSPHCQLIECPIPAKPSNGHVTYTSLTVGGKASYSCSPGYVIEGSKIQFCLPSMMWKGVTPSCRSTTITSGDGSGDCDCVNGGTCHFALDGTEQGSGMDCVCPLGFSGNKCQDEGL